MKAAVVGLGKLGLPVAMAMARIHTVVGYDKDPKIAQILASQKYPHREKWAQEFLEYTRLQFMPSIEYCVRQADIVFLAVETPHRPEYEGTQRMSEERSDFSYVALKAAFWEVAGEAERQEKHVIVVVISTALPGTCERELYPYLNKYVSFVYNPFFIAMGTVIPDFLNPEFILLGCDDKNQAVEKVQQFYREIFAGNGLAKRGEPPFSVMSVKSAELTKVAYNVFLGLKITAANAIMEIAHKVGANCDDVTNALALATDRVVSSKYMRGGGGDSGPCHPRDQIALSWLAEKLDLSYDLFGAMVHAREDQTEWLCDLCCKYAATGYEKIVVLGKAYKKGTNLTVGSYATLLVTMLKELWEGWPDRRSGPRNHAVEQWDPHVDVHRDFTEAAVFCVATDHLEFYGMQFPAGSVVVDPWGKMQEQAGVTVVRVGRG